ncbi:hypothetical protein [Vogesella indigofera]|uniref:hypothetical protein n=1 Tax=Vogesella indigofera TaxID=45465 RepID=UPI00234C098C|nr:hypothetical protein [Vogesella indigofera]MDC7704015.1 hypothetical protein [Vogesella indigofera]
MNTAMTSCPIVTSLGQYLAAQDRDECLVLAIEAEADLMLDDEKRRAQLADSFTESLYSGTDDALLAEFHAFVGKQLLRAAFDHDPVVRALYPNLAKAAREWVDLVAEVQVKKEAA